MKFNLLYEIKGTRLVEVTIPEGVELPKTWDAYSLVERDEWIYENQSADKVVYEDIDVSDVLTVREIL